MSDLKPEKTIAKKKDKKDKAEKKAAKLAKAAAAATTDKAAKKEKKAKKKEDKADRKRPREEEAHVRRSPRLAPSTTPAVPAVPEMALAKAAPSAESADVWRAKHLIESSEALPDPVRAFSDAPFDTRILQQFQKLGWTEPSPVQAQAWPIAMGGRDIIAVAKTGSGKTLGFLLPIFHRVRDELPLDAMTGPLAVVLAPTRELAVQIHLEAERFGTPAGVKVACVYGGTPKGPQIGVLSRGRPAVVVATPGRINDILALDSPPVTDLKERASL